MRDQHGLTRHAYYIQHTSTQIPNSNHTNTTTYALPRQAEFVVAARELDARAGVPTAEEVHGGAGGQVQVLYDIMLCVSGGSGLGEIGEG